MTNTTIAVGGGFAITGTNYLELNTTPGQDFASFTVAFGAPQRAFGFYGMDVEFNEFTIKLNYADGTSNTFQVPVSVPQGSGGVFYFGIVDKPFTSVEFQDTGGDDGFFFDDLTAAPSESVLPPRLDIQGLPVALSWDSFPNYIYQLQYSSSLLDAWNPLGSTISGDGSRLRTNDATFAGQSQRFYRFVATSPSTPLPAMGAVESTKICIGGANSWFGRASIKRLSDGTLVMVYYHASGHAANDGALHIRFSITDGLDWTSEDTYTDGTAVGGFPMNPSNPSPGEDAGEPWLMVAPNGDLLLHMWRVQYGVTAHGTYQTRSTDGGRTWSTSAEIDWVEPVGDDYIFATDDDFVLDGVIYIAARVYIGVTPDQCRTTFDKSTDNGVTWHEVSSISQYGLGEDTQECGLEYVGSNTVVAVLRSLDDKHTYSTRSTDLGLTWEPLTEITATLPNSGRQRIRTRSHLMGLTNWWMDPVLIMNGFTQPTDGTSSPRRNCVWVSLDRGLTWCPPFYVDSADADGGYGDMFWDRTSERYAFVSYKSASPIGFSGDSDLIQYKFRLFNLPDSH
jgi:hypothetical protein